MAVDLSTAQAHVDTANGYLASGDYASAITYYQLARGILAALPDGQGEEPHTLDRVALDSQIRYCQQQLTASKAAATGGMLQRTSITYKRTTT